MGSKDSLLAIWIGLSSGLLCMKKAMASDSGAGDEESARCTFDRPKAGEGAPDAPWRHGVEKGARRVM